MTKFRSLDEVTEAIAAFGPSESVPAYVERRGSRYGWSPAHRGGPYPLSREVASFLEIDHRKLLIGFKTLSGWCVISPTGNQGTEEWLLVKRPTEKARIARVILTRRRWRSG
jgi:hypothetical protein